MTPLWELPEGWAWATFDDVAGESNLVDPVGLIDKGRAVLPRTNQQALGRLQVPVPPLNEQRRIAARIDALQHCTRRARTALDAIPPLLEEFRRSVLMAAFRGDLTADWRARNPDVEPASGLLERLQTPREIDRSSLPRIPSTWCWVALPEVGLHPQETIVSPAYLESFKRAVRDDLARFAPAPAPATIDPSILNGVAVPVPPHDEMRLVAERIDALLRKADLVARRVADSHSVLDSLDRSILAKAFRGHLVPQNPNDEPAAKLLERIGAEKSVPPAPRRARRKPKAKPTVESSPQLPFEPEHPQLASAREYTLDDWRRALLSSLGHDPADRQDAIEAAAIWAAENMGLVYERLPKNGLIVRGLKSALRSTIRRGEVERLGGSWVRMVGRGSGG